jgi:hypothetical protein
MQATESFASVAKQLFVRSQGLQLYRDAAYNLCQAYMNHMISGEEYMQRHDALLKIAADLIGAQIPSMTSTAVEQSQPATAPSVTAPSPVWRGAARPAPAPKSGTDSE